MDDLRSKIRKHISLATSVILLPDTLAKEKDWDTAAKELLDASILCLQKGRESSTKEVCTLSAVGPKMTPGTPVSKEE